MFLLLASYCVKKNVELIRKHIRVKLITAYNVRIVLILQVYYFLLSKWLYNVKIIKAMKQGVMSLIGSILNKYFIGLYRSVVFLTKPWQAALSVMKLQLNNRAHQNSIWNQSYHKAAKHNVVMDTLIHKHMYLRESITSTSTYTYMFSLYWLIYVCKYSTYDYTNIYMYITVPVCFELAESSLVAVCIVVYCNQVYTARHMPTWKSIRAYRWTVQMKVSSRVSQVALKTSTLIPIRVYMTCLSTHSPPYIEFKI